MKVSKNNYLKWFAIIVLLLALIRLIFPSIADDRIGGDATVPITNASRSSETDAIVNADTIVQIEDTTKQVKIDKNVQSFFFDANGNEVNHRIKGVHDYKESFPDSNDVQLSVAKQYGIPPVENRQELKKYEKQLVSIDVSPYFDVDDLKRSVPLLVPRASLLLYDIGRAFFDSLQVKQVPLHKLIVTSALRTRDDVTALRGHNKNATENSCHMYGTTFDICYNRYVTVSDPDGPKRREVQNDTLKWILSEVLRDKRENNRCYIKYEVKQGCFHITTR